jgi:hypothetical protein
MNGASSGCYPIDVNASLLRVPLYGPRDQRREQLALRHYSGALTAAL